MTEDFERLGDLIKLVINASAVQARLDQLTAATVKVNETKAAAERAEQQLAARVAELDGREAAVRSREVSLHGREQRIEHQRHELAQMHRGLTDTETRLKMRLLHHAGALAYYNPNLQSVPSWDAVDAELSDRTGALDPASAEPDPDHGTAEPAEIGSRHIIRRRIEQRGEA
jgi:hypothetical protein